MVSDHVIFNGHDLSTLVYCKLQRPIMAPVSATFENVAGRHGEVFKSAFRSGYDLPVDLWLRSNDRRDVAEVRHRLAKALWCTEPAPLYLPDDPTRYLMAIVSGPTDLGEITDDCPTTTVTFHIGDPAYYGQKRHVEAEAGTFTINAGGDLATYLTVTAEPSNPAGWYIRNVGTGEQVKLASSVASGGTVRLDMAAERATVNGNTAAVTLDSDFFEIDGRTKLQISDGTALLEWRERWL